MAKLLLVIGAVLVTTVSRSDGVVTLPRPSQLFQQGRTYTINCQITGGETFVAWETPGIPSETITLGTTGRRVVIQTGDNYGLEITDVIANDGGVYRCVGSSESKEFTANVDININIQNRLHQTLHLGRKETLVLGVSAYPALTYTWTKDGQPVSFDARRTLDGRTGSITFSSVQLPDQGNYTCNVKNALSSHQYDPIRVQVIDSPVIDEYQGNPVKRRLTQGYNATFYCKIKSGAPKPTIGFWYGWTNKDKKVDEKYTPRYSHPTPEEWTITGVTTEDKGKFRCIAENVAGQDDLKIEITEVDIPPKIDPPLTDVVVNKGDDLTIACKVTGLPAPTVEWFDQNGVRVPDQLTETEGVKIVQKISFRNVQWQNMGKYTCRAKNDALDSEQKVIVEEQTISLKVNSPPKLLPSPNPVYSFMGNWKPTIILCKFSGFPAPLVKMVNENGTEVASGNGSATFTIPVTDSEDVFGNYNCSAVNTFGNDGVLLELKVAVIPGPPRQVFANTTCKDVTLKWEYPESDGGMVITNYVIRVLDDSKRTVHQETIAGNLREADINYDNFTAETKYEVELMARNDVGYGKRETISATTKEYCVPGKPTITNAGDEVDSTFILTWSKPNYDGLDSIIKYKVEWRKKPITDASVFFDEKNIDATQLTVNNLEGGAEYEFKVFAENRAGLSEPDTMTFRVRKGSEGTTGGTGPNEPEVGARTEAGLGPGAIAGIVIAVILIVLITIDLFCCFFNSCGVIFCCHKALCGGGGSRKDGYKDGKATEMEKQPLPKAQPV